MRLSTRIHGFFDYGLGVLLLANPWILGLSVVDSAGLVLLLSGGAMILNAVATIFEAGAVRRLQIPLHLWIDGVVGLLLALSPWLLGFDRTVWIPHFAAGALIIIVAIFTDTIPGYDRRQSETPAGQ